MVNGKLIKVCGMREPRNICDVEAAGPDWMGFILWPGSKRYVARPPGCVPSDRVRRVGVFVDPGLGEVVRAAVSFRLHLIQLHGSEPPAFCLAVKEALARAGLPPCPIVKAFSIAAPADLEATRPYLPLPGAGAGEAGAPAPADYFLFDTKSPLAGGSGRQFDWGILDAYSAPVPFLLSGGIGPEDAGRLRRFRHPRCMGFDLNSRFETAPGMKDAAALKQFIHELYE